MSQTVALLTDQELAQASAEEAGFGMLRSERGPFPLQALSVRAAIDGLLADVEVCQTFVNVFTEALEATYIFPLPDRAAVSSFVMEVAGRRIEGVLKERSQARADYDSAIQAGHRAAISEEERSNVFSLRVGNLLPNEQAKVRFRMAMPLLFSGGEATFRFPLVVAPRYIPGTPLPGDNVGSGMAWDTDAVPDASRISPPVLLPGFPNPVQLAIAVDINPGGLPLSNLRASLHGVSVTPKGGGILHVELQPQERLNRDFILRFRLGDQAVRTGLLLQPDAADADAGTFTLTVVPPRESAHAQKPRDLVFLLDRSGSMGGWKIVAARRALASMIDTLTDVDRFNVFAFDDTLEAPPGFTPPGLKPANASNRSRCIEWLRKVDSRGGTELYQPLDTAVSLLTSVSPERERVLVLITDGQVGNEAHILGMLKKRLAGMRVFALGIDQAVNEGFLKRLAQLGGGVAEMVESEARLEEVMSRIHRCIGTPVLTDLQIQGVGLKLDVDSVTPHRLPDLFVGTPLVIAGRYTGQARGNIRLSARNAAGGPWQETVQAVTTTNPAHTKLWARNRLRDLEDLYDTGAGTATTLEQQIIQTSLQFGVLCRFTAFVAVDHSETANPGGKPREFVQPVDAPAGWDMFLREQLAGEPNLITRGRASRTFGLNCITSYGTSPTFGFVGSRRFLRLLPEDVLGQDHTASPQDYALEAFRQSAEPLLRLLRDNANKPLADRLKMLTKVAKRLRKLLGGALAFGLPAESLQALRDLHTAITQLLANASPSEAEVKACWEQAEQVLSRVCNDGSGNPQTRRKPFWK